jgi:hypothetical protein
MISCGTCQHRTGEVILDGLHCRLVSAVSTHTQEDTEAAIAYLARIAPRCRSWVAAEPATVSEFLAMLDQLPAGTLPCRRCGHPTTHVWCDLCIDEAPPADLSPLGDTAHRCGAWVRLWRLMLPGTRPRSAQLETWEDQAVVWLRRAREQLLVRAAESSGQSAADVLQLAGLLADLDGLIGRLLDQVYALRGELVRVRRDH